MSDDAAASIRQEIHSTVTADSVAGNILFTIEWFTIYADYSSEKDHCDAMIFEMLAEKRSIRFDRLTPF
jgi:hypothetical protein